MHCNVERAGTSERSITPATRMIFLNTPNNPTGRVYPAETLARLAAVLTGIGRQALLSRLVADIRAAAVEAGLTVVDDVADRRALTAAGLSDVWT